MEHLLFLAFKELLPFYLSFGKTKKHSLTDLFLFLFDILFYLSLVLSTNLRKVSCGYIEDADIIL